MTTIRIRSVHSLTDQALHSKRVKVTNKRLGMAILVLASILGVASSSIIVVYLPDHQARWVMAPVILALAPILGQILNRFVAHLPETRPVRLGMLAVMSILVLLPLLSIVYPKRVTYSRFGLTVWGAIPIPFFDIRVNHNGMLWFRPKTHMITMEDVTPLLSPEVEVLIIGTGWQEIAQVDSNVRGLTDCDVRVLSTPDAYAEFNRLKGLGVRVVLLAHSTC